MRLTSRDGRFIAFVGHHHLWLLSIEGNKASIFTTISIGPRFQLGGAAFDPSGQTLAVIAPGKVALFTLESEKATR